MTSAQLKRTENAMTQETMNFALPEGHAMLRESVRKFAEKQIAPKARELDKKEQFSEELTRGMGELGLFGIVIPAEYGGPGMGFLAFPIACEEMARRDRSPAA